MIQKFDGYDRRILTFPAVHPCEGISPATLLESLITLSQTICSFQSKFFATQRRNSREAIRQIGILLMFFEEVRDRRSVLSDSAILCFSELHLAFQKILFLLEDITREGAKTWILMKSYFVSTQFRVLIRTLATALDVLPLDAINVSYEIKELAELVAKQSRKTKLDLDPDDETAMERVILILNQFENRFQPEPSLIKRVLDYLKIKNWSDCNEEIKFLDGEIGLVCSDRDEREAPLLSSLLGFMSYCRGVLFETNFTGNFNQTDGRSNFEMLSCLNAEDFRCPISLELMTDPVTVSTGQTYDRASIQKWLKSGNLLCPKTGEKLKSTELVPNAALRHLIHQFCADNGISLSKSKKKNRNTTATILAGSPAGEGAVNFLADFLAVKLSDGTDQDKNKAAYEIRLLAKSSLFNRSCLIEAKTIPPLLGLLISEDPTTQENAIAALLKLTKDPNGKKVTMENGGLELILWVLKYGLKLETRQIAAATIFYLSSVHQYRRLIGENPESIPALLDLIKNGTDYGKKNAVVAIFGLILHRANHKKVLDNDAVPLLVDQLSTLRRTDLIADSLAVLATLAECFEGSIAVLKASALPLILKNLQGSSSRPVKEYCVSILLSLCNNCGAEVTGVLAKDRLLVSLLYSVLTDGTSHAGKKARSLLKILQNYQETSASGLAIDEVPQEQFIHVH